MSETAAPEKIATPAPRPATLYSGTSKVMAIVPSNLDEVWRLAKAIAAAGWAPKHYMAKDGTFEQEKIAVAIMHGMEVGFTPIAALQSIAVINGMPSIYGDGALALVLASGLMEDYKETRIVDQSGKVIGYSFWAKRRGRATPIEQKFEREDAARAGLIGKQGPWTQYEPRMYQMRARGWGLRDGFADVLKGLAIAEEAMDIIIGGGSTVDNPAMAQPTAQRGAAGLKAALATTATTVIPPDNSIQHDGEPPNAASQAGGGATLAGATEQRPAAPATKPAGTIEVRDALVKSFAQCADSEVLALTMDGARNYEWSGPDQAVIKTAYDNRLAELEG